MHALCALHCSGPVVEVVEAEELEDDEERRSASVTASSLSEQEYQEFLTGQGGSPSHSQPPSGQTNASQDNTAAAEELSVSIIIAIYRDYGTLYNIIIFPCRKSQVVRQLKMLLRKETAPLL